MVNNTLISTAYNRLNYLKRANWIRFCAINDNCGHAWTLTKRGFKLVEPELPELVERGYKPDYCRHDLFCSAIHLGEWLMAQPDGVELYSEQDLRRIHSTRHPSWVPDPRDRISDGYWRLPQNDSYHVVALEVELTLKRDSLYDAAALFYKNQPKLSTVIWVVNTKKAASKIYALLTERRSHSQTHQFFLLRDIMKDGWSSRCMVGSQTGNSIAQLLCQSPMPCPCRGMTQQILDARLKRTIPTGCPPSQKVEKLHRVALLPNTTPKDDH